MKKIILIILLLSVLISANGIQEKTESIIKNEFGENVEIAFSKYHIPAKLKNEIEVASKQRFFAESLFVWLVTDKDSIIAIGLMDNVYGKAQPITFLTIFSLDGSIYSNHVVKYREERGGQIANKKWNKQFVGMDTKSDVNKVDAISGATISVNSIKKGVRKLILLYETIENEVK
ncbi:MAG: FMN-binding protein [Melioribacteraceae bacterium]|nr:FMN-binding protein [Melioribacteraceae bacterium]